MTGLIDEPGPFETLAVWEQSLAEVRTLPPSVMQQLAIVNAQKMILRKRQTIQDDS